MCKENILNKLKLNDKPLSSQALPWLVYVSPVPYLQLQCLSDPRKYF